ncbi:hypothetical protein, partial [Deinococcus rubellus]|uniref:hypothetical protein n=1 Tax=Deinococcus rubellus TaxID=1889240 RepID=UPI0031E7DFA1
MQIMEPPGGERASRQPPAYGLKIIFVNLNALREIFKDCLTVTTQQQKLGIMISLRNTLTRPCQTFNPCLWSVEMSLRIRAKC